MPRSPAAAFCDFMARPSARPTSATHARSRSISFTKVDPKWSRVVTSIGPSACCEIGRARSERDETDNGLTATGIAAGRLTPSSGFFRPPDLFCHAQSLRSPSQTEARRIGVRTGQFPGPWPVAPSRHQMENAGRSRCWRCASDRRHSLPRGRLASCAYAVSLRGGSHVSYAMENRRMTHHSQGQNGSLRKISCVDPQPIATYAFSGRSGLYSDGVAQPKHRRLGRELWDGARLRTLRDARGLSQKDLGELAGVGETEISRHEGNGPKSNPTIAVLGRISKALNVPLSTLFEPADNPFPRLEEESGRVDSRTEGHPVLQALLDRLDQRSPAEDTWRGDILRAQDA